MSYINELIYALMALIPLGAGARIGYCVCKIMGDPDQEYSMKRRIKNLAAFVVISECALSVISIIKNYF